MVLPFFMDIVVQMRLKVTMLNRIIAVLSVASATWLKPILMSSAATRMSAAHSHRP